MAIEFEPIPRPAELETPSPENVPPVEFAGGVMDWGVVGVPPQGCWAAGIAGFTVVEPEDGVVPLVPDEVPALPVPLPLCASALQSTQAASVAAVKILILVFIAKGG